METSLGAAMLLRPLFPRPFPPGSGESVNLGKHVLVFLSLSFFCVLSALLSVSLSLSEKESAQYGPRMWFWQNPMKPSCLIWKPGSFEEADQKLIDRIPICQLWTRRMHKYSGEKMRKRNFSFGTILFLANNYIFDLSIKEIHEWRENNPTNIKRYWKKLMTIDCDWRNLNCWVKSWL